MAVPVISSVMRSLFGTRNQRMVKRYLRIVDQVNALEPSIRALTDAELRERTAQFRARVAKGEDWYYLRYAGVRPDCQGQGLGGLTIRAGIAEATAAGKPTLLETATEGNVGIYLRLGFAVHEEWDVPAKDGPHFWSMSRPV